jgi:hypothetical protein
MGWFSKKKVPVVPPVTAQTPVFITTREVPPHADGTTVRLRMHQIEGVIADTEYDKQSKCLRHLLQYIGQDGEQHERWFLETELEEVK